ncbi:hypothetical protein M8542_24395 [Amycolatopsis sp. OK19-0408]|uniref:Glycosyl hydrolase family 98 putative carbohydrate-binding module domain-containing protein n=1 Tax=Amycolatopsis iheyensis TaxID=2945988 RepID=A0A9X2NFT8_9PSEU|nr:hypothetical protein [Amycolatopsis iheyensis]MCR6485972.1 hypothetical protein [Amycolatopsis iheyensis]
MAESELARDAVSVLSQYLQRKSADGPAAYNAALEGLLTQVQARFSEPFLAEVFARFTERPTGSVETGAMRLYLSQEISRDGDFARQLKSVLGGRKASKVKASRKGIRWAAAVVGVTVLLAAVFVAARVTQASDQTNIAAPTTVTLAPATGTPTSTSASPTPTTESNPDTSSVAAGPAVAGDGSSVPKGAPVSLLDLPLTNNEWHAQHGDHDVQLTQYPNSLWNMLATCNSGAYRGEQQFRLKNFTRLEVKAVGTDSTASPDLAVKFEVFLNDDGVNPKQTLVVNPGEKKPFTLDLPENVFALKLRTSFTVPTGRPCRSGNAVWGSPHVVAAGR